MLCVLCARSVFAAQVEEKFAVPDEMKAAVARQEAAAAAAAVEAEANAPSAVFAKRKKPSFRKKPSDA